MRISIVCKEHKNSGVLLKSSWDDDSFVFYCRNCKTVLGSLNMGFLGVLKRREDGRSLISKSPIRRRKRK